MLLTKGFQVAQQRGHRVGSLWRARIEGNDQVSIHRCSSEPLAAIYPSPCRSPHRSTPHAPFSLRRICGNAEKKGEGPVEPNGPGRPVKGTQGGLFGWKRLLVAAAEDVGLAAPEVVEKVCGLALAWRICRKKSYYVNPHYFSMAVMLLCEAPKDNRVEDLQTLSQLLIKQGERRPIPPYTRDGHTAAGRRVAR